MALFRLDLLRINTGAQAAVRRARNSRLLSFGCVHGGHGIRQQVKPGETGGGESKAGEEGIHGAVSR